MDERTSSLKTFVRVMKHVPFFDVTQKSVNTLSSGSTLCMERDGVLLCSSETVVVTESDGNSKQEVRGIFLRSLSFTGLPARGWALYFFLSHAQQCILEQFYTAYIPISFLRIPSPIPGFLSDYRYDGWKEGVDVENGPFYEWRVPLYRTETGAASDLRFVDRLLTRNLHSDTTTYESRLLNIHIDLDEFVNPPRYAAIQDAQTLDFDDGMDMDTDSSPHSVPGVSDMDALRRLITDLETHCALWGNTDRRLHERFLVMSILHATPLRDDRPVDATEVQSLMTYLMTMARCFVRPLFISENAMAQFEKATAAKQFKRLPGAEWFYWVPFTFTTPSYALLPPDAIPSVRKVGEMVEDYYLRAKIPANIKEDILPHLMTLYDGSLYRKLSSIEGAGMGLFCKRAIRAGELITYYDGLRVTTSVYNSLLEKHGKVASSYAQGLGSSVTKTIIMGNVTYKKAPEDMSEAHQTGQGKTITMENKLRFLDTAELETHFSGFGAGHFLNSTFASNDTKNNCKLLCINDRRRFKEEDIEEAITTAGATPVPDRSHMTNAQDGAINVLYATKNIAPDTELLYFYGSDYVKANLS